MPQVTHDLPLIAEPKSEQMRFLFDFINNILNDYKSSNNSEELLFNAVVFRDFAEIIMAAQTHRRFTCIFLGSESKCGNETMAHLPFIKQIGDFCLAVGCKNVVCNSEIVTIHYNHQQDMLDDLRFLSLSGKCTHLTLTLELVTISAEHLKL